MKIYILIVLAVFSLFTMNSCKKKGCMVSCADNFDSKASEDDGSCSYATPSVIKTATLNDGDYIDLATGKIDSVCFPSAESDLRFGSNYHTNPGGNNYWYETFSTDFNKREPGDTACSGPMTNIGSSFDLIANWEGDQSWCLCERSEGSYTGSTVVVANGFHIVNTGEGVSGKLYKVHVDAVYGAATATPGVTISWAPMDLNR
jgi:hypothetical protein